MLTHALDWTKGLLRNEIEAGYPAVRSVADIAARVRERTAVTLPASGSVAPGGMTPSCANGAT